MSDYTNYMRVDVSKYVFISSRWDKGGANRRCVGVSWKVFWFSYLGLLVPTVSSSSRMDTRSNPLYAL